MIGTDGYTISSGMYPSYLRGEEVVTIPLDVDEEIRIGIITHKEHRTSYLAGKYIEILERYVDDESKKKSICEVCAKDKKE